MRVSVNLFACNKVFVIPQPEIFKPFAMIFNRLILGNINVKRTLVLAELTPVLVLQLIRETEHP